MRVCFGCGSEIVNKRSDAKYCSEYCGNKVRNARFNPSEQSKARKLELQRQRRSTIEGKYKAHKQGAEQRGIEFKLTFEEWWSLWKPHWQENLQGKVCMCRNGDEGAYEVGNVRIDTWQNNIREAKGLPLV